MTLSEKIELIKLKTSILQMKADQYNWACCTDDASKIELEKVLVEVTELLCNEDRPLKPTPTPTRGQISRRGP